ncbi:hypothetical protein [Desulfovibrio aminophilus]|uniref:hypothetical protein n=1 Tax=Desulfovibrio aminophilus TaxID=81425 RepID=UPI0033927CC6
MLRIKSLLAAALALSLVSAPLALAQNSDDTSDRPVKQDQDKRGPQDRPGKDGTFEKGNPPDRPGDKDGKFQKGDRPDRPGDRGPDKDGKHRPDDRPEKAPEQDKQ